MGMTFEEAIIYAEEAEEKHQAIAKERYNDLMEYFGDKEIAKSILDNREEFKQWLERLKWNTKKVDELARKIQSLEQEPCEDEYIKVPKKALKYRTKGMIAYNAEWLKNHFDIERAVICGVQQLCEDCISREAARDLMYHKQEPLNEYDLDSLPSVQSERKRGRCETCRHWRRWIDTDCTFCDLTEQKMSKDDFCSKYAKMEDKE